MVVTVLNCVATIISSLAACFSVVISYYNIKETNRNNKEEKERMNRQEWYQQLILVNLVPEINGFVAESTILLEACGKQSRDELSTALRECYDSIKTKKRRLESNIQSIKIFDSMLQREIQKELERMLDFYSGVINASQSKQYLVYYSPTEIAAIKVEMIDKLYKHYLSF